MIGLRVNILVMKDSPELNLYLFVVHLPDHLRDGRGCKKGKKDIPQTNNTYL